MNDWDIRKTSVGEEWTVSGKEIDIDVECYDGSTHYVFLKLSDLEEMVKALT